MRVSLLGAVLVLPSPAAETNLIEILHRAQEALSASPATQQTARLPAPAPVEETPEKHVLRSQDVLQLQVDEEPDLSLARAQVAEDGTIAHPVLGAVKVAGKTLEEARAMIHQVLAKDYLVNPRVTLTLLESASSSVTVAGQVLKPGTYSWNARDRLTLLKAVGLAGGITRSGSPAKVTVQRVMDGRKHVFRIDLEQMAKSRDSEPFYLRPGDVVEVGGKGP